LILSPRISFFIINIEIALEDNDVKEAPTGNNAGRSFFVF
jgi:hypothetical protein